MKSNTVSIIIPFYNEARHLSRCIQSVISQTHRDLEVILVDDGSSDDSARICAKFAQSDSRIRIICLDHQGLSAARNAGLDLASSNYIQFVDSDDWILPTMTEELMTVLKEDGSDVAQCDFYSFWETSADEMPLIDFDAADSNTRERKIYTGEELYLQLTNNHIRTVVQWNKLFKREVLDGLRFPIGKLHEDEFIIHRELVQMKSLSYLDRKLYVYMQHPNSITHQRSLRNLAHICEAFLDRTCFYVENKIYSAATITYAMLLRTVSSFEKDVISQGVTHIDNQDIHEWLRRMKEEIKAIPNDYFP